MAEATEIPEAKDPFERSVALTIAIFAVILSIISTIGDNAKSESLLSATRAANRWAFYQSKSIKEHTFGLQREALELFNAATVDESRRQALVDRYGKEVTRYEKEKDDIKAEAEALEGEVAKHQKRHDRCAFAEVFMQVAIVLSSVAILVRWRALWLASIAVGALGAVVAVTAFL